MKKIPENAKNIAEKVRQSQNVKFMETMDVMPVSEKWRPKIFFSGSIRGGRQLLETYQLMYNLIEETGAESLCWHVADPEMEKIELEMTEKEIYSRDMDLLVKSDALIAEVTVPSIGVGYEICRALSREIPVLCLHRPDAVVSSMILGNPNPLMEVQAYPTEASLKQIIINFIKAVQNLSQNKKV
jgi:2'-deoxynucleoside 5'-phosphate N-hydrolase